MTRILSIDQEKLDQQFNTYRLKYILRELTEKLKKSNQLIANSNYQQSNGDQNHQTCLEHAKAFMDSTLDALSASFDLILQTNDSKSDIPIEYGAELALKNVSREPD